jgi:hypothetical protein
MQKRWGAIILLGLCTTLFAIDTDTIPIKRQTQPTDSGESAESTLLRGNQPAKSKGSSSTGATTTEAKRKPYIASLEAFGSTRVNEFTLREYLGKDLDVWLEKGLVGDPTSVDLEAKLKAKIKSKWGFPFVEWSVVQYFQPGDLAIHVTLDVVEAADVNKRMPFYPAPTKEFSDPDQLIRGWVEYENTALALIDKGELQPETADCAAFHCPFGHKHPKLRAYEKIFLDGVKKHQAELVQIQSQDRRGEFRGAATFLLAYLKDGKKVVQLMVDRIKDPDDLVRNNALRVLGDIAEFHQQYVIPLNPVLEALYFPRVSDRSKSVYVVFQMVSNSQEARDEVLKTTVPELIRIMASKQPDHRELAHGILTKISGQKFGPTDLRAWNNWYAKLPDRSITKK